MQQQNQGNSTGSNPQSISAEQQPKGATLNPSIGHPNSQEKQWREDQKVNWERQAYIAKWLNWITGLAAIIAIGGLYYVSDQARTARISADAAAASSAAWITLENISFFGIEDNKVIVVVGFRNVGKTPAVEVSGSWTFTFVPGKGLKKELIPQFGPFECPEPRVRPGIIRPDEPWVTKGTSHEFKASELKMIADGNGKLFIHGCAKYKDVLSPEKERITEFAAYYPPIETLSSGGTSLGIYDPYYRMK